MGRSPSPKKLRERRGIEAGDEVVFIDANKEIRIIPPVDEERLAEGYKRWADRSRQLAEELEVASAEATRRLGDAPEWIE